jgi:hypothetical protein
MHAVSSLLFIFSFPPVLPLVVGQDQCYFLDGTYTPDNCRCNNATTGHSTCCETGAACWSNGVCQKNQTYNGGVMDYLRPGCTDPIRHDPACLDVCPDRKQFPQGHAKQDLYGIETGGELVVPAGQVGVRPCDGMSGTQYCCDGTLLNAGDFSCCSTSSNLFSIAAATSVVATIPGQRAIITPPSTTCTSAPTSISTTRSSTNTQTSDFPTGGYYGPTLKPGVVVGNDGLAQGAKVWLGVGIPIVASLLGILGQMA